MTHDHQQYLIKNPFGYRCHSATGIKVPRQHIAGVERMSRRRSDI